MSVRRELLCTKCCCCIPLRVGCFLLGYANLLLIMYQTKVLLTFTTYVGVATHGFDHFDLEGPREVGDLAITPSPNQPVLQYVAVLLALALVANVTWLFITVACLVGLHKRKPGPICLYIWFTAGRLLLSLAGFIHVVVTTEVNAIIIVASHAVELVVTGYVILIHYLYTVQLENEKLDVEAPMMKYMENKTFTYPPKIDRQVFHTEG